jgi:D-amino-acid oxidase
MNDDVAVIGAGVSGLTCGVLLAERGYRTTIFARETGDATTSAAAAAIWFPYDAGPAEQVSRRALATFDSLRPLTSEAASGVSMIELRVYSRTSGLMVPEWTRSLGAQSLATVRMPPGFRSGYALTVPLLDTTIYLHYLRDRFERAGGTTYAGTAFPQLTDVPAEYEHIINCAGVGARELVNDRAVEPHRGQVAIVGRSQLEHAIVCDDPPLMYAIPRAGDCVWGGTNTVSEELAPDGGARDAIIAECTRVLQLDAPPPLIGERVGLRPFRFGGARLEREQLRDGRRVVHNYGHGGAGFTLSWGCAADVLALVSAP